MKEDLIADLWHVMSEHIPEKQKKDVAFDFVNVLLDYGIKESVLSSMLGIDPHLDEAIEYSLDAEDDPEYEEYDEYKEDDE
jgi:hypothetical protein